MGAISYRPSDEVLVAVAAFAKEAGFRKFSARFRLATEGGHALVLLGEDGMTRTGHREAHWHLYVCHKSWADVYQAAWERPLVVDPLKFDPSRHEVARFSLKGRKPGEHPGFSPDDPEDVEDYIRHVHHWFSEIALPMALEWLRNPTLILEHLNVARAPYDWHPDTRITMGLNGVYQDLIATVLAADMGDVDRAQEGFSALVRASESDPDVWLRWVEPVNELLVSKRS